ncbi:MAG: hypothetical protein JO287_24230 [Pseudonocardiales bacterium]|nr:hypothetical protein [Pseudonocardiales bacterium]
MSVIVGLKTTGRLPSPIWADGVINADLDGSPWDYSGDLPTFHVRNLQPADGAGLLALLDGKIRDRARFAPGSPFYHAAFARAAHPTRITNALVVHEILASQPTPPPLLLAVKGNRNAGTNDRSYR